MLGSLVGNYCYNSCLLNDGCGYFVKLIVFNPSEDCKFNLSQYIKPESLCGINAGLAVQSTVCAENLREICEHVINDDEMCIRCKCPGGIDDCLPGLCRACVLRLVVDPLFVSDAYDPSLTDTLEVVQQDLTERRRREDILRRLPCVTCLSAAMEANTVRLPATGQWLCFRLVCSESDYYSDYTTITVGVLFPAEGGDAETPSALQSVGLELATFVSSYVYKCPINFRAPALQPTDFQLLVSGDYSAGMSLQYPCRRGNIMGTDKITLVKSKHA